MFKDRGLDIENGYAIFHAYCPNCNWHGRVRVPTRNFRAAYRVGKEPLTTLPEFSYAEQLQLLDAHEAHRTRTWHLNCGQPLEMGGEPHRRLGRPPLDYDEVYLPEAWRKAAASE
jgi:hypothetical protein